MLNVSDEVVGILREGGKRCKNFLEQVGEDQKAITRFCRHYSLRLRGIETGAERGKEEPLYCFSDGLGMYTVRALRLD